MKIHKTLIIFFTVILIQGCTTSPYLKEKYTYDQLPGWYHGNQKMAMSALKKSCSAVINRKGVNNKWLKACQATLNETSNNNPDDELINSQKKTTLDDTDSLQKSNANDTSVDGVIKPETRPQWSF